MGVVAEAAHVVLPVGRHGGQVGAVCGVALGLESVDDTGHVDGGAVVPAADRSAACSGMPGEHPTKVTNVVTALIGSKATGVCSPYGSHVPSRQMPGLLRFSKVSEGSASLLWCTR